MKTRFNLLMAGAVIIAMAFIPADFSLTGKWKMHDPKGGPDIILNFKADNTYAAYTGDNKLLVIGKYNLSNDTFAVNDNNCGGAYWGTYKFTFFGDDSLAIKVIEDSCSGRAQDIDGLTAKRIIK